MNLMIIGNDTDSIALDVWKANTNYTVLNQSPYVWGSSFKKFVKNHLKLIDIYCSPISTSSHIEMSLFFMGSCCHVFNNLGSGYLKTDTG